MYINSYYNVMYFISAMNSIFKAMLLVFFFKKYYVECIIII